MLFRIVRLMYSSAILQHSRAALHDKVIPGSYRNYHRSLACNQTLPEGSWDSHIHIIEPEKYPFPPGVTPPEVATMSQGLANAKRLGLQNLVFVQLTTYGNDNAWVLDALKEVGPAHGRGVVDFDPENIDRQTLQKWHDIGVRGVRVNLRSSKTVLDKVQLQNMLRSYAERLRPMKTWSIGLYADMEVLEHVQPILSELKVKLVIEHFGSPAFLPVGQGRQPGWGALQTMMHDPRVYVKFSAPYLFSNSTDFRDFDSLAMTLLKARGGEGVVFGSDWPHTQARGYDVFPFERKVVEWCNGDKKLIEKVFRDNARELWDIPS